jgi:hypothetical protein
VCCSVNLVSAGKNLVTDLTDAFLRSPETEESMSYLAAASVLACLLGALNLVLVMGVIKRLREMAQPAATERPQVTIRPGARPEPFTAEAVDGALIDADGLANTLVGFLSPECPACTERLPQFLEYARAIGGRDRTVAVLIGAPDELGDLATQVRPVARVVMEPSYGPVAAAFSTVGFPAVVLLDGAGVVSHSGTSFVTFPKPAQLARESARV